MNELPAILAVENHKEQLETSRILIASFMDSHLGFVTSNSISHTGESATILTADKEIFDFGFSEINIGGQPISIPTVHNIEIKETMRRNGKHYGSQILKIFEDSLPSDYYGASNVSAPEFFVANKYFRYSDRFYLKVKPR